MQRSPMGGGLRITKGLLLKSLLVVLILAGIYYVIDRFLGSFFAWGVIFLITFNIYLIYRVSIKQKIKDKVYGQDEIYESDRRPGQAVPQDSTPDVEGQQTAYEAMQQDYETCPECEAGIIPGLQYCEECGYQFS